MEFQAHDTEIGFRYDSAAIVPDGTEAPPPSLMGDVYTPVTRPGHRLPHVWLTRGGEQLSTLDLVGRGRFTLLVGPRDAGWREAAAASNVAIDVVAIGDGADYRDPSGDWARLRGIDEHGAILVRPDGHVGWRMPTGGQVAERKLADALAAILGGKLKVGLAA
jgi:2,4-dichlorophenol 6-monooxygenase